LDLTRCFSGDVLELIGNDIARRGQLGQEVCVVVRTDKETPHRPGAGNPRWIQEREGASEWDPGEPEHAPELAAAHYTDAHPTPNRQDRG
jgi:hypothetical protein